MRSDVGQGGNDGSEHHHVDKTAGLGFLEEVLGHHTQLGEDHAQHQPQDGVVDVGQLTQPYREQAADYCQQNVWIRMRWFGSIFDI